MLKRMRSILPLSLACAAAALAQAAGSAPARAEPGSSVNPIRITSLAPMAGKYLHVFYVSGREAAIGTPGEDLKVRAVLKPLARIEIPASGVVDLPRAQVPRARFLSFNYLVIAISGASPETLFLRNADRSEVIDPRAAPAEMERKSEADFQAERKGFVSVLKLARLPKANGAILLDAAKDLM